MTKWLNDYCYAFPVFCIYLLIIDNLAGIAGQRRESLGLESIAIKNNQALSLDTCHCKMKKKKKKTHDI